MGIIHIIGGIGLILFGVRFLRKGLDRLFGNKLVVWLSKTGKHPVMGFLSGLGAGTIAPSSTAISLVTMQMLGSGRLQSRQLLILLLGANVGFTVVIQLVSFQLQDYAGLLVFSGVILFQFCKEELWRGIGQCLLSLGFIFLAIGLIDEGSRLLGQSRDMAGFLHLLEKSPWLVFLGVAGLTVVMQSSNATVGLGLGMLGSGILTGAFLVPWVIGTSLGVGITSMIAGWSLAEGRRLAVGSITMKLLLALPLLLFPELGRMAFEAWPADPVRQTAMFNTFFNLAVALAALPLLGPIERFTRLVVPLRVSAEAEPTSYLDKSALETTSFALAHATRETLRMASRVRFMFEHFWAAFSAGDTDQADRLREEEEAIDRMHGELKDYLSRISEAKSSQDTRRQFVLLSYCNELETVADVVDESLCPLFLKQAAEGVLLVPEDRRDLGEVYGRLLVHFAESEALLTTRSGADAARLLGEQAVFRAWCGERQEAHYKRLHETPSPEALRSSALFLEFLSAFRRADNHLCSIAESFSDPHQRDGA